MPSNFDYYSTITGFYIDGLPFPMPKNFEPKLVYIESEKRSLNNTLTIDRFAFEDKMEFDFDWSLTTSEFEMLQVYLNGDFVPCIFDIPNNSINKLLRFKYTNYEQVGERVNITVNAKEL